MKKIMLLFVFAALGQYTFAASNSVAATPNIGKLITMFTGSLSPDAFTSAWDAGGKKEFTKKVKNNANMPVVGAALSNLASTYLTDAAFKTGWQTVKSKWIKDAAAARTVQNVAGSLLTLQQYINPSMFTSKWTKIQPYWETGLKTLAS